MGDRILRLGVLGAGTVAHLGVLSNLGGLAGRVELVAVADPVLERARQVARDHGIPRTWTSLEAMLDGVDLDGVLNLTPIPLHGTTNRAIVEAGMHLATEKPLATTMEDADAIVELACSKHRVVVASPPNMLYPDRREARRLVDEGVIGKVAFARVRSSHAGPGAEPSIRQTDPTWFYQRGTGPLFDMGVYGIDEITGILGPARRVVAFSGITEPVRTVRTGPFRGRRIEVTADDNTLLMLDFGGSTYAVLDATYNVNAAKGPKIEIFGREGTINLGDRRGGTPPLEVFRLDALPGLAGWVTPSLREQAEAQRRYDGLGRAALVEQLVDAVDGGPNFLSGERARHTLEIMVKADESARTGRSLDLATTFSYPMQPA